jgi:hypothetical protein
MSVQSREPDLVDYLDVMRRRGAIIVSITAAILLAALAIGLMRPPLYRGTASFIVTGDGLQDRLSEAKVLAVASDVPLASYVVPGTITLQATFQTELEAREAITGAADRVGQFVKDAVETRATEITRARDEIRRLTASTEKLQGIQATSLDRIDPLAVVLFQSVSTELERIDRRRKE